MAPLLPCITCIELTPCAKQNKAMQPVNAHENRTATNRDALSYRRRRQKTHPAYTRCQTRLYCLRTSGDGGTKSASAGDAATYAVSDGLSSLPAGGCARRCGRDLLASGSASVSSSSETTGGCGAQVKTNLKAKNIGSHTARSKSDRRKLLEIHLVQTSILWTKTRVTFLL